MPRTARFAQHHEVLFGRNWEVRFYAWQPSASHPALDDWQSLTQQEPLEQRRTDAIDFCWQRRAPGKTIPADHFATVAHGTLQVPAGEYAMYVVANDGVRVSVDGQQRIDQWSAGNTRKHVARVSLDAAKHAIDVEHFEVSRDAELRLWFRRAD